MEEITETSGLDRHTHIPESFKAALKVVVADEQHLEGQRANDMGNALLTAPIHTELRPTEVLLADRGPYFLIPLSRRASRAWTDSRGRHRKMRKSTRNVLQSLAPYYGRLQDCSHHPSVLDPRAPPVIQPWEFPLWALWPR